VFATVGILSIRFFFRCKTGNKVMREMVMLSVFAFTPISTFKQVTGFLGTV
jgi:hypothetical protein